MNPSTGTFISMDTYQGSTFDPITLHKYLYANANPVMNCDPSGYSATLAENKVAMVMQGILDVAWRVASNSAVNLGMKILSSLNQIIITATPVVMLLGNNPAFLDLCDRVTRGEINPIQLAEQIKDEIVKAVDSFKEKFGNSSNGDPGNFDPNNWKELLTRAQEKAIDRLDNIFKDHLKPSDFEGVQRELEGERFPKPGGGYWNHIQEMKDSYVGIQKSISTLNGSLQNPNLDPLARNNLTIYYNQAVEYIKQIEQIFLPYGGIHAY